MNELIRKQDALDAIHCNITVTGRQNAELVAAAIGVFADRIKALPPVQPEILASGEGELNVPDTDVEDMISRQAVIDLLKQMRKDGDMVPWEGKNVFAGIRKLPSAQADVPDIHVGKWIPVSERLPETEEAYTDCMGFEDGDLSKPISPLTCYESGLVLAYGILDECSEGRQIFVATYDEWKHHETGKIETGWKDNVCGDDCKVFAWMPLPEPWKGE